MTSRTSCSTLETNIQHRIIEGSTHEKFEREICKTEPGFFLCDPKTSYSRFASGRQRFDAVVSCSTQSLVGLGRQELCQSRQR